MEPSILVISPSEVVRNYMKCIVDAECIYPALTYDSADHSIEAFESHSIQAVICDGEMADLSLYMLKYDIDIPVFSVEDYQQENNSFPRANRIVSFLQKTLPEDVFNRDELSEYVQVTVSALLAVNSPKFQVYYKAGSNGMVVTVNKDGEIFDDIRAKHRNLTPDTIVLIDRKNARDLVEKFQERFEAECEKDDPNLETLLNVFSENEILFSEVLKTFGWSERVIELTRTTTEAVYEKYKSDSQFTNLLQLIFGMKRNTARNHSSLTAMIASGICQQFYLEGEDEFDHVVTAALLKDMALTPRMLQKHLKGLTVDEFESDERQELLKHPIDAQICFPDFYKKLPVQVQQLIQEHHERPDGTGYPGHVNYYKISPLSAIFILAVDIADEWMRLGKQVSVEAFEAFFNERRKLYKSGHFKMAFDTVYKEWQEKLAQAKSANSTESEKDAA